MELRKVVVSRNVQQEDKKWKLEEVGEASFHCFGVGYEEFETGAGNYSTAIVEWPTGVVESVPVDHVRFVTSNAQAQRREFTSVRRPKGRVLVHMVMFTASISQRQPLLEGYLR